jgi:hypothetical protein
MGISHHERSSPVIDQPQKQQHEEIMNDRYHHTWRHIPAKRLEPPPQQQQHSDDEDKHVSFTSLEIREYKQVLGDHPCCSQGPPVSLGWDYTESPKVTVERYEATRARRRSKTDLKLSFEDRRDILSSVPEADVRRVQRRLSRERCAKDKIIKSFFGASSE